VANKNLSGHQNREYQPGLVTLRGAVPIGAAGAVGTAVGRGYTVVKTGTGIYTVTLNDRFSGQLEADANLQLPTGSTTSSQAQPGPYTAPTSTALATFVIYTFNSAGAALADPPNGSQINFRLVLFNTSER
jgi:hypothetical protein